MVALGAQLGTVEDSKKKIVKFSNLLFEYFRPLIDLIKIDLYEQYHLEEEFFTMRASQKLDSMFYSRESSKNVLRK